MFQISNISDISYLQWGEGIISNISVLEIYKTKVKIN